MGGFLRGFDDPRVHTGSADLFVREFRTVLDLPALHLPGGSRMISYAAAAATFQIPLDAAAAAEIRTPVAVLLQGLCESSGIAAAARQVESPTAVHHHRTPEGAALLRGDLEALLRVPALLFYLQVSHAAAFFSRMAKLARQEGFPLAAGSAEPLPTAGYCPACGSKWAPGALGSGIQTCASCGKALEVLRSLPLVPGVGCRISYELLRRIVAIDLVVSYQEEGDIRPLRPGSTIS